MATVALAWRVGLAVLIPEPAWGSTTGALSLVAAVAEPAHSDAMRVLISERIHCYAWAFDERRRDLLAGCFTSSAVWHGDLAGAEPVPPVHGREEIVTWLTAYWDRQTDQRRHFIMSLQIDDLTPTTATATCSLLLASIESELTMVLTSFYRVALVFEHGEWLIDDLFEGGDVPF